MAACPQFPTKFLPVLRKIFLIRDYVSYMSYMSYMSYFFYAKQYSLVAAMPR